VFRSLHMKLVLVLVLLVISVMAVVGTFLINSVTSYNIDEFLNQMSAVFTPEFLLSLEDNAAGADAPETLREMLEAYSGPLGLDENRSFYILDPDTGAYLAGSDDAYGAKLTLTPNILSAMNGEVGQKVESLGDYFDVAIPLRGDDGAVRYVVGVLDNKTELQNLNWNLFTILMRAMLFGLVVAVLLSFLLSKTITTPVERLTAQAARIAAGDFGQKAEIYSTDEIGILTQTFNEMAETLEKTLQEVGEERSKLDTLFRHMADGVVAFDAGGRLMHVNPAAERMLGKSISADARYADVFPNIQLQREDLRGDGRFVEVDYAAGTRILKIFFAPLGTEKQEQGIMAVLHDITEQRKLDESRREFVANVSHELRTPLTNVRGYTETLLENPDIDRETETKFLTIINGEADRMTRIVKDLLTLTRLDYDRMEIKMEPVDLVRIGSDAARAMAIEAEGRQLTLRTELPESLPLVEGDGQRLQQVVINILSNAIKYNRPGGSVTLLGGTEGGRAFLRVADTGIGVPKEDLPRVFERFYRVDKARSRESGGTGLGLAIARQIIENHGGSMTFESEYGKGSVVTMYLPIPAEGGKRDA